MSWCYNNLRITGKGLKKLNAILKEHPNDILNCLLPMPNEINSRDKNFNWRMNNWGVEYDFEDTHLTMNKNLVILKGYTPIGPPAIGLCKIAKKFNITIVIEYESLEEEFGGIQKLYPNGNQKCIELWG